MRHALEDGFGSPFSGGSGSAYSRQPRSHVRQKKLFVPDCSSVSTVSENPQTGNGLIASGGDTCRM